MTFQGIVKVDTEYLGENETFTFTKQQLDLWACLQECQFLIDREFMKHFNTVLADHDEETTQ